MSPTPRHATQQTKARQRHRRQAYERLAQDRRQAQHAADDAAWHGRLLWASRRGG